MPHFLRQPVTESTFCSVACPDHFSLVLFCVNSLDVINELSMQVGSSK